ncbi:hypothetical protein KFV05_01015 [Macrococcoides canis]|uniref:hypothetical protein n=1 Tax=Macrococcoides canis TaxID=1855823 RepID=UPI0020B8D9BE|nr:hypothetical protein [Macrococcus canis]UTH02610.1 hypothetical protein KFV05_01015 [Macrococcus canis]
MRQFRKISTEELFPTEQLGPEIEGTVLFPTPNGMSELRGAYIATSERLFMNIDMGERVYERVVGMHEIHGVESEDDTLTITFDIGPIKMVNLNDKELNVFTDFLQQYIK